MGVLQGDLGELLDSPTVKYLISIPEAELFSDLINDAYKPKMHKMYSEFYCDVMVDFCLNVRKSPFPLDKIKEEVRFAVCKGRSVTHWSDLKIIAVVCSLSCESEIVLCQEYAEYDWRLMTLRTLPVFFIHSVIFLMPVCELVP